MKNSIFKLDLQLSHIANAHFVYRIRGEGGNHKVITAKLREQLLDEVRQGYAEVVDFDKWGSKYCAHVRDITRTK